MQERELLEDMEKDVLVDRYGLDYEGVFDYLGMIRVIDNWCKENHYYKEITSRKEFVNTSGRKISISYDLQNQFKKLWFSSIKLDVDIEGMKEVDIEVDGKMRTLNKGKVEAIFNGFIMTSLKARWETKAYAYFLRGIVDKFIYKVDKPAYRGKVVDDTFKLINTIKGELDVYRHIAEGKPAKGRLKGGWV